MELCLFKGLPMWPPFLGAPDVGKCYLQTGEFWGTSHVGPNVRDTPKGKFDWKQDNPPWGDVRCPISSHIYIRLQHIWGGYCPAILLYKLFLGDTDRNERPPQFLYCQPVHAILSPTTLLFTAKIAAMLPWNFHSFFCIMGIHPSKVTLGIVIVKGWWNIIR